MKNKNSHHGFKPQENLISILPSILAGIIVLSSAIASTLIYFPPQNNLSKLAIVAYGILGSLYLAFYYFIFRTSPDKDRFSLANAIITGIALGTMSILIPDEIDNLLYTLVIIAAMSTSLISTRGPSYILVFTTTFIHFIAHLDWDISNQQWVIHLSMTIASIMAIETVQQLKKIAREQINRLEIINELSRQIVSTLETKQVFALLNAAFQNALEADSYYIGVLDGDELRLELFYDDGEFF